MGRLTLSLRAMICCDLPLHSPAPPPLAITLSNGVSSPTSRFKACLSFSFSTCKPQLSQVGAQVCRAGPINANGLALIAISFADSRSAFSTLDWRCCSFSCATCWQRLAASAGTNTTTAADPSGACLRLCQLLLRRSWSRS